MQTKKMLFLATLFIALPAFAQCFNTEEQYTQKVKDMLEQCEKMNGIVPCAVGFRDDYPFQDKVLGMADDNALIELAKNVEAFIRYHSKDSTHIESDVYMEEAIAKRLEESVSKVNVKQRLANTKSLKRECVSYSKNGKTLYKGASLRVLDNELYENALNEVKEEAKANETEQNAAFLKSAKKAAKKYVPLASKTILRFFGFPLP
jgi:DNA gyrase/topoisomerase IV subunit B